MFTITGKIFKKENGSYLLDHPDLGEKAFGVIDDADEEWLAVQDYISNNPEMVEAYETTEDYIKEEDKKKDNLIVEEIRKHYSQDEEYKRLRLGISDPLNPLFVEYNNKIEEIKKLLKEQTTQG